MHAVNMHAVNVHAANLHAVTIGAVNTPVVNRPVESMHVANIGNHARKGAKRFLTDIDVIIIARIIKNSEFLYVSDVYVALFCGQVASG